MKPNALTRMSTSWIRSAIHSVIACITIIWSGVGYSQVYLEADYAIEASTADMSIYANESFDLNILIIGSTHSFSEGGEHDVVHEKPFNPTNIATHLEGILRQDTILNKTVKVEFEDIYKSKSNTVRTSKTGINDITAHCYSLAQHFMWPDGKTTRLSKLRSEDGTQWDYIVLCSDPYIMANFPGMYAEGVKLIQREFDKTVVPEGEVPPKLILMAQWPENSSTFTADDFNEVVHRVGGSAGLTVVPAGKVWDSYTSQDTNTAHPTPKGAYLAAASIYSKLYPRSAKTSGYSFTPGGDAIADLALSEVQAIAADSQYSGTYSSINPFQMKYVSKRVLNFRETGTSTEQKLAEALDRLDDVSRISFIRNQGSFWDFNYGRGNDRWEDSKDYEVNPAKHDRAYGFPMHHYYTDSAANAAAQTMPYGIDKYYYGGTTYEDGTDLGIAYNMIRPNTRELSLPQDVRAIPIRLMWLKMEQASPGFNPLGDDTHMHAYLNDASAAFMYSLMSGRCPVVEEPATQGSAAWMQWLGHKVGYETAWQMSHLTTCAPGFRVLPSHVDATMVSTTVSETMTVQFMNPPQSNVTVSISSSNPAVATVSPSTLTFTPTDYATPQNITVSGVAAESGLQNFNVLITSSSTDEIYDGLSDAWGYTSNTDSVSYGQTVLLAGFDGTNTANTTSGTAGVYKELTNPHKSSTSSANVNASFSTTGAVVGGLQWGGMTSPTTWGSVTYTPNATTTSNLIFAADNEITCSLLVQNTGINLVTLEKLHFRLQRDNATGGSADQATITLVSGNLTASGPGVQALSSSSGGFNYDFDLSSILTDATLAAGESATFTLSFVPTDPAGANRRIRVDNLALAGKMTESSSDNTAPNPNPMSWASEPTAVNSSSIAMTATTASDPSGVEYYFTETSGSLGGSDSGWQDSPAYTDTGLTANTSYTYTVTARDKAAAMNATVASASASATTASNPVNAGTSTVVASSASVPANNSTTSTITVTLKDAGGTPVSGKTVSLFGNGSATIQTSNNTSNASGVVTFTVKSSSAGTETFTATGDSIAITQTVNVQFTAVVPPPSAGEIIWTVHSITGNETEVSNAGTTVIAASGADGGATANVVDGSVWATVNGVSFTDDFVMDAPSNMDTLNSRASIGVSGEYYKMLQFADRQGSGLATWTFNGLTIGNTYQIQIWAQDNVSTAGNVGQVLNNGGINTPVLNSSGHALIRIEASGEGSAGQYALGTFVANTTTQQFQARAYTNLNTTPTTGSNITINAYQLRDLGAAVNTFASWISGFNVGAQTAFSDDPDQDGVANGIESYFGTHPGELTVGMLMNTVNTGAGTFTFTHPINDNPASDLTAAYRWSKNLTNFYYGGQSDPGGTTVTFTQGAPSGGMVSAAATITGTSTEKIFVDIEVSQN